MPLAKPVIVVMYLPLFDIIRRMLFPWFDISPLIGQSHHLMSNSYFVFGKESPQHVLCYRQKHFLLLNPLHLLAVCQQIQVWFQSFGARPTFIAETMHYNLRLWWLNVSLPLVLLAWFHALVLVAWFSCFALRACFHLPSTDCTFFQMRHKSYITRKLITRSDS